MPGPILPAVVAGGLALQGAGGLAQAVVGGGQVEDIGEQEMSRRFQRIRSGRFNPTSRGYHPECPNYVSCRDSGGTIDHNCHCTYFADAPNQMMSGNFTAYELKLIAIGASNAY